LISYFPSLSMLQQFSTTISSSLPLPSHHLFFAPVHFMLFTSFHRPSSSPLRFGVPLTPHTACKLACVARQLRLPDTALPKNTRNSTVSVLPSRFE
jgi:hypothetical protein